MNQTSPVNANNLRNITTMDFMPGSQQTDEASVLEPVSMLPQVIQKKPSNAQKLNMNSSMQSSLGVTSANSLGIQFGAAGVTQTTILENKKKKANDLYQRKKSGRSLGVVIDNSIAQLPRAGSSIELELSKEEEIMDQTMQATHNINANVIRDKTKIMQQSQQVIGPQHQSGMLPNIAQNKKNSFNRRAQSILQDYSRSDIMQRSNQVQSLRGGSDHKMQESNKLIAQKRAPLLDLITEDFKNLTLQTVTSRFKTHRTSAPPVQGRNNQTMMAQTQVIYGDHQVQSDVKTIRDQQNLTMMASNIQKANTKKQKIQEKQNTEFEDKDTLPGPTIEEWINKILEPDPHSLNGTDQEDIKRKLGKKDGSQATPAKIYGIDLMTLNQNGINFENGRRLQKSLFVHTTGFHRLLKQITQNCKYRKIVQANIWGVYHKLLESCEKVDYKFLINEVAAANEEEKEEVRQQCADEINDLQMQTKQQSDNYAKLQSELLEAEKTLVDLRKQNTQMQETLNKNQQDFEKQVDLRLQTEAKLGELFAFQSQQKEIIQQLNQAIIQKQESEKQALLKQEESEQKYSDLWKESIESRTQYDNLKIRVQAKEEAIVIARDRYAAKQMEYTRILKETSTQKQDFELMRAARDTIQLKLHTSQDEIDSLKQIVSNLEGRYNDLEQEYLNIMQLRDEQASQIQTLQVEYYQYKRTMKSVEKDQQQLQEDHDKLKTNHETITKERDGLLTEKSSLTLERDKLQQRSTQLSHSMTQAEASVHKYYTQIAELERKLEKAGIANVELEVKAKDMKQDMKDMMKGPMRVAEETILELKHSLAAEQAGRKADKARLELDKDGVQKTLSDMEASYQLVKTTAQEAQRECTAAKQQRAEMSDEVLQMKAAVLDINAKLRKKEGENSKLEEKIEKLKAREQEALQKIREFEYTTRLQQTDEQEAETRLQAMKDGEQLKIKALQEELTNIYQNYKDTLERNAMHAEDARGVALQKIWRIEGAETKAKLLEEKLAGFEDAVRAEKTVLQREIESLQMRLQDVFSSSRDSGKKELQLFKRIEQLQDTMTEMNHERMRLKKQLQESDVGEPVEYESRVTQTGSTYTEAEVQATVEMVDDQTVMPKIEPKHKQINTDAVAISSASKKDQEVQVTLAVAAAPSQLKNQSKRQSEIQMDQDNDMDHEQEQYAQDDVQRSNSKINMNNGRMSVQTGNLQDNNGNNEEQVDQEESPKNSQGSPISTRLNTPQEAFLKPTMQNQAGGATQGQVSPKSTKKKGKESLTTKQVSKQDSLNLTPSQAQLPSQIAKNSSSKPSHLGTNNAQTSRVNLNQDPQNNNNNMLISTWDKSGSKNTLHVNLNQGSGQLVTGFDNQNQQQVQYFNNGQPYNQQYAQGPGGQQLLNPQKVMLKKSNKPVGKLDPKQFPNIKHLIFAHAVKD